MIATAGCVIARYARRPAVAPASGRTTPCRSQSGMPRSSGVVGAPSSSMGTAYTITSSCWIMCIEKWCSPSRSIGDSIASTYVARPP